MNISPPTRPLPLSMLMHQNSIGISTGTKGTSSTSLISSVDTISPAGVVHQPAGSQRVNHIPAFFLRCSKKRPPEAHGHDLALRAVLSLNKRGRSKRFKTNKRPGSDGLAIQTTANLVLLWLYVGGVGYMS